MGCQCGSCTPPLPTRLINRVVGRSVTSVCGFALACVVLLSYMDANIHLLAAYCSWKVICGNREALCLLPPGLVRHLQTELSWSKFKGGKSLYSLPSAHVYDAQDHSLLPEDQWQLPGMALFVLFFIFPFSSPLQSCSWGCQHWFSIGWGKKRNIFRSSLYLTWWRSTWGSRATWSLSPQRPLRSKSLAPPGWLYLLGQKLGGLSNFPPGKCSTLSLCLLVLSPKLVWGMSLVSLFYLFIGTIFVLGDWKSIKDIWVLLAWIRMILIKSRIMKRRALHFKLC